MDPVGTKASKWCKGLGGAWDRSSARGRAYRLASFAAVNLLLYQPASSRRHSCSWVSKDPLGFGDPSGLILEMGFHSNQCLRQIRVFVSGCVEAPPDPNATNCQSIHPLSLAFQFIPHPELGRLFLCPSHHLSGSVQL